MAQYTGRQKNEAGGSECAFVIGFSLYLSQTEYKIQNTKYGERLRQFIKRRTRAKNRPQIALGLAATEIQTKSRVSGERDSSICFSVTKDKHRSFSLSRWLVARWRGSRD